MSWNHRIVRKKTPWTDSDGVQKEHVSYGVHEAYYTEDGKVSMITENPVDLDSDTLDGLKISWDQALEAFGQPILDFDKIPEEGYDPEQDPIQRGLQDIEEGNFVELDENDERLGWGDFDNEAYEREEAEKAKQEELDHEENYIGKSKKDLIRMIWNKRKESL